VDAFDLRDCALLAIFFFMSATSSALISCDGLEGSAAC
jgi:hypothetical protein